MNKVKSRDKNRVLSSIEQAICIEEAESRGLPKGWSVYWDNKKGCKIWISPCRRRKCDGIPEALAVSVKMGLLEENKMPEAYREKFCQNRVLSPEEVEAAMKEAKARGLPDGWTVEYNNKHRGKLWISPDGKKCTSIPQAIAMSRKMGMEIIENKAFIAPKRNLAPQDRFLSPDEIEAALKKARNRGLPPGWTVQYNTAHKGKIWISPDGRRRCDSIPKAIAMSVKIGLLPPEKTPEAYKKYVRNQNLPGEEVSILLKKAGLPANWKVEWDNMRNQRVWIDPQGKKCYGIPQAHAMALKQGQNIHVFKNSTPAMPLASLSAMDQLAVLASSKRKTRTKPIVAPAVNPTSLTSGVKREVPSNHNSDEIVALAIKRHKRQKHLCGVEEIGVISCHIREKESIKQKQEEKSVLPLQSNFTNDKSSSLGEAEVAETRIETGNIIA